MLGKALIADLLPPPEYVIEAYLETTLAVTRENASEGGAQVGDPPPARRTPGRLAAGLTPMERTV